MEPAIICKTCGPAIDSVAQDAHLLSMITLTENAARQLTAMKQELGEDSKVLRMFVEAGGCSGFEYGMGFDEPKAEDKHMESNGVPFIIDPSSLIYLDGCEVDFDDGLNGKGFEIKNPNATSTCGCGKSFN